MTDEEFTPEESEALKAMEQETPEPKKESEPEVSEETTEPEAKEEPKAEFKSTRSEEKPPEGYVPHQAMHAERMKRQELEKKIADLEAKFTPKEEPPQYVDPLEDPQGYRKYDEWSRGEAQKRLEQFEAQQRQTAQQQQRFAEAQRMESEFAQATPDYPKAAEFLHKSRIAELRNQGYGDAEISQQIAQDANALFDAARQVGMNPAELLYIRAQRSGYTKEAEKSAESEEEKIVKLAEAQQKTQGVGSAGGSKQSGKLTAEQLGSMSEAEFDKAMRERPDEVRRAMGG